jgi:hypothetical protein
VKRLLWHGKRPRIGDRREVAVVVTDPVVGRLGGGGEFGGRVEAVLEFSKPDSGEFVAPMPCPLHVRPVAHFLEQQDVDIATLEERE